MSWLSRVRSGIPFLPKRQSPDTLWHKCAKCGTMVFLKEWEDNLRVCPRCDFHDRIGPKHRFEYIFDGSATGSDASFDKWLSANGATAVTLDSELGAMNPNTSGFGMKWYPVEALGDVVVRLEYMWPAIEGATPNGGVMVRFPDPRYVGTTAEVLAQKPTGYNYDLCPSAAPAFCGLPAPAPYPRRLPGRAWRPRRWSR